MDKIVECVPNFSEGGDEKVIQAIADAISSTEGVSLLDVDPGPSTNRTVYTFVGTPGACVEGAVNAARAAASLIDMRNHTGEHPRLGVMDVCPFVPVRNVSMDECIECAKLTASRLAEEIDIPVFLYGEAAVADYRRRVPQIRAGEYEALEERITQEQWKPDYGPAEFRPKWGASIVGARNFLVAYNVNLLSTKEQAHRIALNIREQGRGKDNPGRLKAVQGIGWYLEEHNLAQVSVNIIDLSQTAVHTVFEEVRKDAVELGLATAGSQIVGLVPMAAIEEAAQFYMEREGLCILQREQRVKLVVDRLGLSSINSFKPRERIIEYMIEEQLSANSLTRLSLHDFTMKVAARTPSPGGGSVSAVAGALGTGLATMAGLLTYGNRKFENLDAVMRTLLPSFYDTTHRLLPAVDEDSAAFDEYMRACKLSATNQQEVLAKDAAKQAALVRCVAAPLEVARDINKLWPQMLDLAEVVNKACVSDVQVAAKCMETAVFGSYFNVLTNLEGLEDSEYKEKVYQEITEIKKFAEESTNKVLFVLENRT